MYFTVRSHRATWAATAVIWSLACGNKVVPASAPPAVDTTSLATLRTRVLGAIGDPTCRDASQCRTIAFGSKPCGGPWKYLVYSTATTDSVQLDALVTEYNAREAAVNQQEGRMSDCSAVPRPRLVVVDGRCAIAS